MNSIFNSFSKQFRQLMMTLVALVATVTMMSIVTHAGQFNTSPISEVTSSGSGMTYVTDETGINQPTIPSVSVDQAADLVGTKMYDIISFLQVIAKPLCILVGVVCAMISLLGVFGDSGMLYKGITGMVLAALCYFGIMYAPQIIAFINGWMSEGTDTILSQTL